MTDKNQSSRTDSLQDELSKQGREVWLAGLGALATVEEEGTKLFNRLVDRGKNFEEERRSDLKTAGEKARKQGEEALSELEEAGKETQNLLVDAVNNALDRFGVPTRTEVDRLSEKVETLSQQVEDLAQKLSTQKSSPSDEGPQ